VRTSSKANQTKCALADYYLVVLDSAHELQLSVFDYPTILSLMLMGRVATELSTQQWSNSTANIPWHVIFRDEVIYPYQAGQERPPFLNLFCYFNLFKTPYGI
jgi:hypothetical protein